MNFIKKALQIPSFFGDVEETKPWESESDPYRRDMMRLTDFCLTSGQDNIPALLQALAEIGEISYIGGSDTIKCVHTQLLPYILDLVKDPPEPSVRTQALKTLSLVAHRNRLVQEYVIKDKHTLVAILGIISDVTKVMDSRWGCYALLMLINDNAGSMKKIRDMEQTEDVLTRAADLEIPWMSWGQNFADVILKQIGLRDYKHKAEDGANSRSRYGNSRNLPTDNDQNSDARERSVFHRFVNKLSFKQSDS